ncbi:MAG TPA: nitrite reductase (NAD(P)H) small subunit [Candidatus Xenobia bacterium]|nr:nitrite reductase (NAD(P)H) small subunit [Candidatus Xenobia bacterium]
MAEWVKVAEAGDIPPSRGKRIEIGGVAVAVFNLDGEFYALEDTCPRDDGSLSQGDLFGDLVQCPIEACKYELATGKCITFDARVQAFPLRLEGSKLFIQLS